MTTAIRVHQFIQTVVIGKTPGRQPATLEVHDRIASVMEAVEAVEAVTAMEKQFHVQKHHDFFGELYCCGGETLLATEDVCFWRSPCEGERHER